MLNKLLYLCLILLLASTQLKAQLKAPSNLLVVDEIYPDRGDMYIQHQNALDYLFLSGTQTPAIKQITVKLEMGNITDLHVYACTKPGSIVFNSNSVLAADVPSFVADLAKWKASVKGKVIIHGSEVFTGEAGQSLKKALEDATGLAFSTQ